MLSGVESIFPSQNRLSHKSQRDERQRERDREREKALNVAQNQE